MNELNDKGEFVYDNDFTIPGGSEFLNDSSMQPLNINFQSENPEVVIAPTNTEEPDADRQENA
jgi:hypothetical protein